MQYLSHSENSDLKLVRLALFSTLMFDIGHLNNKNKQYWYLFYIFTFKYVFLIRPRLLFYVISTVSVTLKDLLAFWLSVSVNVSL